MSLGQEIRLNRIFDPRDQRAVVVAADHGMMIGPIPGVQELAKTLERVAEGKPDAVLLSPGQAEALSYFFRGRHSPSLLVRVDWTNTFRDRTYTLPVRETSFGSISTPRYALKLGAHAVVTYLFIGYEDEGQEARHLALVSRYATECARIGLPLIVEPIPFGPRVTKSNNSELTAAAVRIAVEAGANALKVPYTGDPESFKRVVRAAAGVPILVLGGYRALSRRDLLEVITETLDVGGSGVVFGRNIVQAADPASVLRDIRAVVHDGRAVKEVMAGGAILGPMRLRSHQDRCSGCLVCTAICSFSHEGVHDRGSSRIGVEGRWPGPFTLAICTQCERCVAACPTKALSRSRLGNVSWEARRCDLCGKCVEACPFHVVVIRDSEVRICDLCEGAPECVEWCSRNALEVVPLK